LPGIIIPPPPLVFFLPRLNPIFFFSRMNHPMGKPVKLYQGPPPTFFFFLGPLPTPPSCRQNQNPPDVPCESFWDLLFASFLSRCGPFLPFFWGGLHKSCFPLFATVKSCFVFSEPPTFLLATNKTHALVLPFPPMAPPRLWSCPPHRTPCL